MLKRTTVYLEENDLENLNKISFIQNVSMAALIRRGVQELCQSFSKDQKKALETLTEIKREAQSSGISQKTAMETALKMQEKVRNGRKKSRR